MEIPAIIKSLGSLRVYKLVAVTLSVMLIAVSVTKPELFLSLYDKVKAPPSHLVNAAAASNNQLVNKVLASKLADADLPVVMILVHKFLPAKDPYLYQGRSLIGSVFKDSSKSSEHLKNINMDWLPLNSMRAVVDGVLSGDVVLLDVDYVNLILRDIDEDIYYKYLSNTNMEYIEEMGVNYLLSVPVSRGSTVVGYVTLGLGGDWNPDMDPNEDAVSLGYSISAHVKNLI